ncbi:hypothetical protein Bca4012_058351 [Brassica carinata]
MSSKKKFSRKSTPRSPTSEDVFDDELLVPKAKCLIPTGPIKRFYHDLPSRSTHSFLKIIWSFARISGEVEFRIPHDGETADNPSDGYFTCYEAFLLHCRLRFPIPEIIVRVFENFEISIGQLGLAVLAHLSAFLGLQHVSGSMFRLTPHTNMSCFFFVRVNAASVEERCIPVF